MSNVDSGIVTLSEGLRSSMISVKEAFALFMALSKAVTLTLQYPSEVQPNEAGDTFKLQIVKFWAIVSDKVYSYPEDSTLLTSPSIVSLS